MSAQLQCIVTEGDVPVDIRWITSGQTHSALSGISITKIGSKSSIMQIDSVDASHSGNYTCTARNSAGQASYTAQLTVVGIIHEHDKQIHLFISSLFCPVFFSLLSLRVSLVIGYVNTSLIPTGLRRSSCPANRSVLFRGRRSPQRRRFRSGPVFGRQGRLAH